MSRDMIALFLAAGSSFVALTMTRPLVPLFATQLGAGPLLVGIIMAAFAALPLFLAVPAGSITDRLGPRTMIIWGSGAYALISFWVAKFPSITVLLLSQTFMGTAQLAIVVAAQTYAGSADEGTAREKALGWFGTSASLGQLIGPLLGGFVADHTSFPETFLLSAYLGLVTPLLALLLPRKEADGREWGGLSGLEVRRLIKNDGVKAGMVSSFAVIFALGVRQTFFPLYLQQLGYSAMVVGSMLSLRAFASVLVRPAMSKIITLCRGRFPVLAGSLFLLGAGVFVTPFTASLTVLGAASILIGFGIGLCQPLSMLAVADSVDAQVRGLAMGIRLSGNRLAQLVNPVFFGAITAAIGMSTAFGTAGVILFGTTAYMFRWREHFYRREPATVKSPTAS